MRYDSQSIHQSGSKVVQSKHAGLKEQFMKRNTELAELLRSASKKRAKTSEVPHHNKSISVDEIFNNAFYLLVYRLMSWFILGQVTID